MGSLLRRRHCRTPSNGHRHSRKGRRAAETRIHALLIALCTCPACALAERDDIGLELGADHFGVELGTAQTPHVIDSSIPALRAALLIEDGAGLSFKQTLIYGSGKSIQGRAWQSDTRLGYRNRVFEYLIFEPTISFGVISVTPDYHMDNQSNVRTKYLMAGTRLELGGDAVELSAEGQIGRNISPSITNVICTPGLTYSVGVEASAKYFSGRLVAGAERKKMPMGSGYHFEVSHIYAGYRFVF